MFNLPHPTWLSSRGTVRRMNEGRACHKLLTPSLNPPFLDMRERSAKLRPDPACSAATTRCGSVGSRTRPGT